jgi:hypothetical protein
MEISNETWDMIQTQLDYSDNDMARFKSDPANIDIITKAMDMAGITITAEVVESHGCFSGHRKGQKIHLDSAGNLLSKKCPDKMCVLLVGNLTPLIFGLQQLMFNGVDPEKLKFKRFGCADVGLACGGWGHVVMEVNVAR